MNIRAHYNTNCEALVDGVVKAFRSETHFTKLDAFLECRPHRNLWQEFF